METPMNPYVFVAALIGIAVVVLAAVGAYIAAHYRRLQEQPEEIPSLEYEEIIARATVVELSCWVHTIGYKTPKTNQVFAVTFRLDSGEEKTLRIPEEMYHGLAERQVGTVTIRDGELYSFELE